GRFRVRAAGAVAAPGPQAGAVRRRRAQRGDQAVGLGAGPLGAVLPRRVRGRAAQPGPDDPLRGPQRAPGRARRAHLRRVARPRGPHARARGPAVHGRRAPARGRVRRARRLVRHRARLHEPAVDPRPRGRPAARRRPRHEPPARARRRPRGVQPRADRRLRRPRGPGRRGGGRRRDHRRRQGRQGRGAGPAGDPRAPRRRPRRVRPGPVRGQLRRGRGDRRRHADQRRRPGARPQAHHLGPRRLALPEGPARPDGRDRPRAHERRDLPRLHARVPLLPGRHDHAPGPRAVAAGRRRDGRAGTQGVGLRRGRPAVALERRPLGHRRDRQGPRRPLRGHQHRPEPAEHPRRRVQRHPGRGADPRRATLRPDVRARGRLGAAPAGDQQDGLRGGAHRHRLHRLRARLAAGEALLHVRSAHRDRRGRAADRVDGPRGDPRRAQGRGPRRHPGDGVDRRVRAQAAHPVPVGRAGRARGGGRAAAQAARGHQRRPQPGPQHRPALPRRPAQPGRGTAQPRRPPYRAGHRARLARRPAVRRLERALLLRALDGRGRGGAPRRPGRRRRVVHHPGPGLPRDPALGPPRLGAGPRLALGRLAGRAGLAGAGRLPLDALLRLWRLPDDGHGDPDRPEFGDTARAPLAADHARRAPHVHAGAQPRVRRRPRRL
ncbi:MAG: FIG092679: Fe-S oxidoreductase, partial [uncultured Actinomycetospora sp.]